MPIAGPCHCACPATLAIPAATAPVVADSAASWSQGAPPDGVARPPVRSATGDVAASDSELVRVCVATTNPPVVPVSGPNRQPRSGFVTETGQSVARDIWNDSPEIHLVSGSVSAPNHLADSYGSAPHLAKATNSMLRLLTCRNRCCPGDYKAGVGVVLSSETCDSV